MTPVHARPATEKNGKLLLAKDAVVFVGGAPDARVAGVLAVSSDAAFFLMPMAKDLRRFPSMSHSPGKWAIRMPARLPSSTIK